MKRSGAIVFLLFILTACSQIVVENTKIVEVPTTTKIMLMEHPTNTLTLTETILALTPVPSRTPRQQSPRHLR